MTEVDASSWDEAEKEYPQFATEKELGRFIQLSSQPVYTAFQQFCRKAVLTNQPDNTVQEIAADGKEEKEEIDNTFYRTIGFAVSPELLSFQEVAARIPGFTGFEVILMKLEEYSEDKVNVVHACRHCFSYALVGRSPDTYSSYFMCVSVCIYFSH